MINKFCFVVPRYGKDIAGGAETLVSELAIRLAAGGDQVDILSTCAKDNRTWKNELPEGVTNEDGLNVYRFRVNDRNLDIWIPLQIKLSEGIRLSLEEQLQWMTHSVNSTQLYEFIAQFGGQYDALYFAPYLFGTTFWGSLIIPEKSILIPCLHDENYAYQDVMCSLFRQVRGCLFNAQAEKDLARELFGDIQGGEVGMGFESIPEDELHSYTPYFQEFFPYVIYVGRKETGKNVHLLIDYFVEAKKSKNLQDDVKLIIAGGGSFSDLGRNEVLKRGDIIDINHVSEKDKKRLIKHSLCLCQPSVNESFSIVLMEAWLLNVPALVHARCSVTKEHCIESGGGIYFGSVDEFAAGINTYLSDTPLRHQIAGSGNQYVQTRYNWQAVKYRFYEVTKNILNHRQSERIYF